MTAKRLDILLVERGLATSRSRAGDMVRRGVVTINGKAAEKPGQRVDRADSIAVTDGSARFVSRGALKLAAALDHFAFPVPGRTALDLGTSTGGFVQVLLERGVAFCYAVDVGRGQLAAELRRDSRIHVLEDTDARELSPLLVPEPVEALTADLSFISLRKALAPALSLTTTDAWLVALVKPQFEAGPKAVGKGGVVRDAAARARARDAVVDWLRETGDWDVQGWIPSPITGTGGNEEFLVGARRRS